MPSITVNIVAVGTSVAQLVYVFTILWLLRIRQKRLRQSAAKLPLPIHSTGTNRLGHEANISVSHAPNHQHSTNNDTSGNNPTIGDGIEHSLPGNGSYYTNFLPNSFHSVMPNQSVLVGSGGDGTNSSSGLMSSDEHFAFPAVASPPTTTAATRLLDGALLPPSFVPKKSLNPDDGQSVFSTSATSESQSVEGLYDEEDAFAPQPSSLASNHSSTLLQSSLSPKSHRPSRILEEEEDEASVVLPIAATLPINDGFTLTNIDIDHLVSEFETDSDDLKVSLDVDGAGGHPQSLPNVKLIIDDATHPASPVAGLDGIMLKASLSREGEQTALHVSAAPLASSSALSFFSSSSHPPSQPHEGPFSQPTDSHYHLLGESSDEHSRQGNSEPQLLRSQSRHILHPRSLSYRGESVLVGDAPNSDSIFAPSSTNSITSHSSARRRADPRRSSLKSLGSSSGPINVRLGVHPTRREAQIDPNASPVRSRVKFADSPRDRQAAAEMRGEAIKFITDSGEANRNSDVSVTHVDSHLSPSATASNVHDASLDSSVSVSSSSSLPASSSSVSSPSKLPRSVLKHRDLSHLSSPTQPSQAEPLVLPIYYRFLILQSIHCAVWCITCLVLLCIGTNVVEWGANQPDTVEPNKSTHFGIVMALLLMLHAAVSDGLVVFLASKNVGRSSIRFTFIFAAIWGLINGIAVLVTVFSVSSNDEPRAGLLPRWHPFFVRTAGALFLNGFVLFAPSCCFCGRRARRTDRCRRSRAERELALIRQQQRWDEYEGYYEEEDTFDEDDYVQETPPRHTWWKLAIFNFTFYLIVLSLYILDFRSIGSNDRIWENVLMGLLTFGFVVSTPVMYWSLRSDSAYWSNEWRSALERMKSEAVQVEERLRRQARDEEEKKKREQAAKAGIVLRSDDLNASRPSKSARPTMSEILSNNFFLDYSILEYGPLLGSGGFSSVYAAKLGGVTDVAVKVLHVRDMSKEVVDQFLHEVSIVLQLVHPNVVAFYGVVFTPPDMVLVMERCRRQSLLHLIKHQKVRFTEFQAVSIALAIADALRYIHEQDIIHRSDTKSEQIYSTMNGRSSVIWNVRDTDYAVRYLFVSFFSFSSSDLKAANILFDIDGRPKICDL